MKPVIGLGLLASLGCAGGGVPGPATGVEPDRGPAPDAREAPRPVMTPVRARFQYAAGTVSYLVTSNATIAQLDSVSAPREFRETARLVYAILPANSYSIVTASGSVETSAARSSIRPYVDTLRAGDMDGVTEPRMPICGRDTVPPMHLVTLLPPVPPELREGLRWQRRLVYGICQGPIPVRVERTDSYAVTGCAEQVPGSGVTVSRNSSFVYAGAGVEGQHNVRVTGSGSGQATFILDASAGQLRSAVEETNSEIEVAASGRTRRFSQRIVRTVTPD